MAFPTTEQLEELKVIAKVKTDKDDEYVRIMANLLLDHAIEYCNNKFDEENLQGGVKIFIGQGIEYNLKTQRGLTSRSMGSVSYSYATDFPESIYSVLRPFKKVRFHALR
ncbi:phage head-tail connector protein [Rummeliibacillus pycnus]|uniref:phage head-tail connector protein n=1 Tax=Rummeliibacillus pycnus TaxID=101070 RepID=UPI0037C58119